MNKFKCILCERDTDEDNLFCWKCRKKHSKIFESCIKSGMSPEDARACANKEMDVPESGLDGWLVW